MSSVRASVKRGAPPPADDNDGARAKRPRVASLVNRNRIRDINEESIRRGAVVYWMSRDQRVRDNWALLYAQERAHAMEQPLVVCFNLVPRFLDATIRQFGFMVRGLEGVSKDLGELQIPFVLLRGDPAENIPALVRGLDAGLLVCDFSPLRIATEWKSAVMEQIPCAMQEVDAHNIVPVWEASDKIEYAARTIRPKIHRQLSEYLREIPSVETHRFPLEGDISAQLPGGADKTAIHGDGIAEHGVGDRIRLEVDRSVPEVDWATPGEAAGRAQLDKFLSRISVFNTHRNNPTKDALSNLSPWLHFGQVSAQRAALEASRLRSSAREAVDSYIEELVVRRELSENYCFYNPRYDDFNGLYPQYNNESWAQKTLREHASDPREVIYSLEELEEARTHDDLWNAAQLEMVHMGKMHGFMRMYWAKKILEWTRSPEEALGFAIFLNDKYELDGRDPNGYVGCAWAIAGLHDQGWKERPVFGKIRYMVYSGCQRKFNVADYVIKVGALAKKARARHDRQKGKPASEARPR